MTRERIEKEARDYVSDVYGNDGYFLPDYEDEVRGAFVAGAEWRINSVWHDAIDKPERNRDFLYESATQAAKSLNLNLSNLVMVCNGKRKNVKGHIARYLTREAAEARLAELKGERNDIL